MGRRDRYSLWGGALRAFRRHAVWICADSVLAGQPADTASTSDALVINRLTGAFRQDLTTIAHRPYNRESFNGRLAQRESTAFTRRGSLVQSQHRPPLISNA